MVFQVLLKQVFTFMEIAPQIIDRSGTIATQTHLFLRFQHNLILISQKRHCNHNTERNQ